MTPRACAAADRAPLAQLWHDGWHEAHAAHLPPTIVTHRNLAAFKGRLDAMATNLRLVGPIGAPLGLCAIDGDELDQLFVAPSARGTGAAKTLLRDGEARMQAAGIKRAHLFCLEPNVHAAQFYARAGWVNMGIVPFVLPAITPAQTAPCIRFERDLV